MSKKLMRSITYDQVHSEIIEVRNQKVILDSDVATLYGVETRDINKAVKNNPQKFPKNYIISLNKDEKLELVENFHRFNSLKHFSSTFCCVSHLQLEFLEVPLMIYKQRNKNIQA